MPLLLEALIQKLKDRTLTLLNNYRIEGLNLYVPPQARPPESQQPGHDLYGYAQQFLANPNADILLITGASGAGKTLFGQYLVKRLVENYQPPQPLPLWIPLLSIDAPDKHLLHKHLQYNLGLEASEITAVLTSNTPLFLILDGYDELNTELNLHQTNLLDARLFVKTLITCRYEALKLLSGDYRRCFVSNKGYQSLMCFEIMPFDEKLEVTAQIGQYIQQYLAHPQPDNKLPHPPWNVTTYLDHLQRLPELQALITNPFILRIVIEALPEIIKKHETQAAETKRVTLSRFDIYDVFTQQWFKRQADKYRREGHAASQLQGKYKDKTGKELTLEELFANYTRRLAKAMFHRHTNVIEYKPPVEQKQKGLASLASMPPQVMSDWTAKYLADEQHPDLPLLRAGCPLIRLGARQYTFLHKSLLEFFAAQHLFQGALLQGWVLAGRNLNQSNLQQEPDVIRHLADCVKTDAVFEQVLWDIIELSKSEPTVWRAAANAATILKMANISFLRRDLRRVRLGGEEGTAKWGADLSGAWLDGADLQDADLRYVNLQAASLVQVKLQGSCLDNLQMGELPYLQGDHICYSPNGQYIAVTKVEGLFSNTYYIILYETATRKELKKIITSHESAITCLSFSPNSQQLASGSGDKTSRLWDVASGKQQQVLTGHTDSVGCVAYRPDGLQLASSSSGHFLYRSGDKTVRLWDVASGKLQQVLTGHFPQANGFIFTSGGYLFAIFAISYASDLIFMSNEYW